MVEKMDKTKYEKMINDIVSLLTEISDEGRMEYHIIPVVEISKRMAKELNADLEVVEIAAYLHDITRITGDIENHHNSGASYAIEFLSNYKYDSEKIDKIARCIRNHRGSINTDRASIEERILASADAASHIMYPLPMFYTWYGKRKCSLSIGAYEIKNKLQRSWNKIEFDFLKRELNDDYDYLRRMLEIEG